MTQHLIRDAGDLRKYFFQIPNMVDDLDLDPIAFRLYCHLKRVAGESGMCWQSTDTLAAACKISAGSITKAKIALVNMGLIEISEAKTARGGKPAHNITITDLWAANIKHAFNAEITRASSPHEVPISPRELASSPHEIKKNPINNNPETSAIVIAEGADMQDEPDEEGECTQEQTAPLPVLMPPPTTDPLMAYPARIRAYVAKVAELLKVAPPRKIGKKGGQFAFWISGATDLAEACGDAGVSAIEKVYRDWSAEKTRIGRDPYALNSPRSFVNSARTAAGSLQLQSEQPAMIDQDGGFYA